MLYIIIFVRDDPPISVSASGAAGGDLGPLTSTPSQKQSRQQLDKRYLSIRKTMASNNGTSSLSTDKFNFDNIEADNSLAAAMVSSSLSAERQRELLIKVLKHQ